MWNMPYFRLIKKQLLSLIVFSDPKIVRDLTKIINYIDARPFKFSLLGIVPMDASLPISIINLSITYIIISLQLTHLY